MAEAELWMRNQDQRRPALPERLTSAEREFFATLRQLVDSSSLSLRALADLTSSPRPVEVEGGESPASAGYTGYTTAQWDRWLNGQSLPPRKAVRTFVEALATADIDAGNLVELWALAFRPSAYPQEPSGPPGRLQQLPPLGEQTPEGESGRDLPDGGDLGSLARIAVLNSYRQLNDPAARLFRLLSVHPGPDVSVAAAASMAAVPAGQAATALDELAKANLAEEKTAGRFACNALLSAYAEWPEASEPGPERDAALGRLLDHYGQTMVAAVPLAYPASLAVPVPAPGPGVRPESFQSDDQARAWCHTELPVVKSLLTLAAIRGLDTYCWQIPSVMAPFLVRSGLLQDFLATQRIALAAALRLGDPLALGHAHYHYAHACALHGEVADSDGHLQDAFQSFTTAGDQASAARTLNGMAQLLMQQGEYPGALEREKEALRLRLAIGDHDAIAHSEDTIGEIYSRLGKYDLALHHCHRSLDLSRETGARLLAADALTTLGFVNLALGDTKRAIASYMEALAIYRHADEKASIAAALTGLGDAHQAAGDSAAARASWQQALALLTDQPNADDQPVRARLGRLLPPS